MPTSGAPLPGTNVHAMGSSPTTTPPESPPVPGEFRRYRRFVSWFILTFVSLGCTYLLISVAVTIYRRRNAVPSGAPVGVVATSADLEGCYEELADVAQGLERHLENFHLVAHYDASEAQSWAEDRAFWLGQWKAADERCHFAATRPGKLEKEWEQLSAIHAQLRETEASFTKELLRFGKDQAPHLDQIMERLERVGAKLGTSGSVDPGDSPQSSAKSDSGETK
jgi:hypothetical protein